jgi:hypothetical protein
MAWYIMGASQWVVSYTNAAIADLRVIELEVKEQRKKSEVMRGEEQGEKKQAGARLAEGQPASLGRGGPDFL